MRNVELMEVAAVKLAADSSSEREPDWLLAAYAELGKIDQIIDMMKTMDNEVNLHTGPTLSDKKPHDVVHIPAFITQKLIELRSVMTKELPEARGFGPFMRTVSSDTVRDLKAVFAFFEGIRTWTKNQREKKMKISWQFTKLIKALMKRQVDLDKVNDPHQKFTSPTIEQKKRTVKHADPREHLAGMLEVAAMRILAGLKETNLVQVLVADEMHMELMAWVEEFAAKFRTVYNEHPEIKQAIDTNRIDPELIKHVTELLQQPHA